MAGDWLVAGEVLSKCRKQFAMPVAKLGVPWSLFEWVLSSTGQTIAWLAVSRAQADSLCSKPISYVGSMLKRSRVDDDEDGEPLNMYLSLDEQFPEPRVTRRPWKASHRMLCLLPRRRDLASQSNRLSTML